MKKTAGQRNTRRAIMDTAQRLLQERGFQGFSYHHIAEELGIRNAAVHYYFPSKADLGLALIQRFRDDFHWWKSQLAEKRLNASSQVRQFVRIYQGYMSAERACALGVVGVEAPGLTDAMRREAAGLFTDLRDWLAWVLEQGRQFGDLMFDGDSVDRATHVIGSLQGALQLARISGQSLFADVAESSLRELGVGDASTPSGCMTAVA